MDHGKGYCRPSIETLSTAAVLESLGPVSAGSSRRNDVPGTLGGGGSSGGR
jgi:hypothetical protein